MASTAANTLLTNFNLYAGMLFNANPQKTQLLSAIGGINGANAEITTNIEYPIGVEYGLDTPSASQADLNPGITETEAIGPGNPKFYGLAQRSNVVQIFQRDVVVSYLRERSSGRLQGINTAGQTPEFSDILAKQLQFHTEQLAINMNWIIINGTYSDAGLLDSTQPIRTRGLCDPTCITTNVIDRETYPAGDQGIMYAVDDILMKMFDNGAWNTPVIVCNSANKVKISRAYKTLGYVEVVRDRFVAGISVDQIITNFGKPAYLMIDNHVPADIVLALDMPYIHPVFTRDSRTGEIIKLDQLDQRGGYKYSMYVEFGLDYGPEQYHGKITNFNATV